MRFVPFSERDEWKDVIPIAQDEGETPLVQIAYRDAFREAMDYFRAVLKADERSERALALTSELIDVNPANFTAWAFRRKCLAELNKDLREELVWVNEVTEETPKNYQVWYHRYTLVEQINDPMDELAFTSVILYEDAKNYHAWEHRQYIVKKFDLWEEELAQVTEMIEGDLKNNSGWNERFHVVSHLHENDSDEEWTKWLTETELPWIEKCVRVAMNNESPFIYLKGIANIKGHTLKDFPEILAMLDTLLERDAIAVHVNALLLDYYESEGSEESMAKAVEQGKKLIVIDPVRKKYWAFLTEGLEKKQ